MPYSRPTESTEPRTPNNELVKRGEDLSLCFWLGMMIPVYGIVVAAIIARADGVRSALKGAAIWAILLLMIGVVFGYAALIDIAS